MFQYTKKPPKRNVQEGQPQRASPNGAGGSSIPAGVGHSAMGSQLGRPSGGQPLDEAMRARFQRQFGLPMDDVRVHRDSAEPAKFDAQAYAYGTHIFLGPGQEDTLAHEMTHVAQQKLGQVRPTGREHGLSVNRSPALEHRADAGSVAQTTGTAAEPVVQCSPRRRNGALRSDGGLLRRGWEYYPDGVRYPHLHNFGQTGLNVSWAPHNHTQIQATNRSRINRDRLNAAIQELTAMGGERANLIIDALQRLFPE